jgi:hypothetical protein
MEPFLQRWGESVTGVLSGFDRLRLRGTLRVLANLPGMSHYLWQAGILLKDFGEFAEGVSRRVKQAGEQVMEAAGRPVIYLTCSSGSKEEMAREIALRDRIESGPVCLIKAVEPCLSYEIHRSREKKKLELRLTTRKCLHYYHYRVHPRLGLLHARLQTWLPMTMMVCLNGREWLCRSLSKAKVAYLKRDNCVVHVSDVAIAQRMLEEQVSETDWPTLLDGIARGVNPAVSRELKWEGRGLSYYWSADQSEWATDVMFRSMSDLSGLYPRLIRGAMTTFASQDVMRFLGRKGLSGRFQGEVVSDLTYRVEGIRIKHRVKGNSVKMYDKQGSVLRVETTINDASEFKVWRGTETSPRKKQWRKMRKGVADLARRAQVSRACNERYLSALASLDCDSQVGEELCPYAAAITRGGRRYRGLRLLGQDGELLLALSDGRWCINGFRNGDVRAVLWPKGVSRAEHPKRSGQVSRRLSLLRAHGLVRRVPRTRRWMLSDKGTRAAAVLSAAKSASAAKLLTIAA